MMELEQKYRTALLFGGSGFIGTRLIRDLCFNRYRVANVDLVEPPEGAHPQSFFFLVSTLASISGDYNSLRNIIDYIQPDLIVNLAAESHVDVSVMNPLSTVHTNTYGAANVLEAGRRYWNSLPEARKRTFRHIQVGTDECYGSTEFNNDQPFTEESPLHPSSPYSASKTAADLVALSYWNTYKYPVIVTRCSNNFGPWQHGEKFIPRVIHRILNKKQPQVYGDGLNVRDWIHVNDHSDALVLVASNGRPGEIYNIGRAKGHTNLEIVKYISEIMEWGGGVEFIQDRPGHDRKYLIDPSKIIKELGWKSSDSSLEVDLIHTVQWYISNRQFLEDTISKEKPTWKNEV